MIKPYTIKIKCKYLAIVITCFANLSCSVILGVRNPKHLSDLEISKVSSKLKIPNNDSYALDTTYLKFLLSLDTSKYKEEQKNHYQPLQALYFDKNGDLKKFYINCYAGGFPLKWNRNGNLDSFLPKDQAPLDTILNLTKQFSFLRKVNDSNSKLVIDNSVDFYVIIYWNNFMRKHSRRLIKLIKENCAKSLQYNVKIIFVNNDAVFAHK